jgi:hypothetical protein
VFLADVLLEPLYWHGLALPTQCTTQLPPAETHPQTHHLMTRPAILLKDFPISTLEQQSHKAALLVPYCVIFMEAVSNRMYGRENFPVCVVE